MAKHCPCFCLSLGEERFMPKAKRENVTPKPEDGFVGTGDVQTC